MDHFLALDRFMFYGNRSESRCGEPRDARTTGEEETVARWIAKTTRIKVRRVQGRIAARRERLLRINAATPRHTLRLFSLACVPSC